MGFVAARALVKYAMERNEFLKFDERRNEDEHYIREMGKITDAVRNAKEIHELTKDMNEDSGDYEDDDAEGEDEITDADTLGDRITQYYLPYFEAMTLFKRIEIDLKKIDEGRVTDPIQKQHLICMAIGKGTKAWDLADLIQNNYLRARAGA